jgi:hypothetical protein
VALHLVVALPNPGSDGVPRGLFYPDTPEGHQRAEKFAQQENRPGWGVFDCIGLFHDGAGLEAFKRVLESNGFYGR